MVLIRHSVTFAYRGRLYAGVWHVIDGDLHLESPYGCRTVELDGAEARAAVLAAIMFKAMVRAWCGPAVEDFHPQA